MKQFYRMAGLTLLLGLLFACSSPPPDGGANPEQIVEADQPRSIESEESETEPDEAEVEAEEPEATEATEATMEEEVDEEEMEEAPEEAASSDTSAVTATDGPTHVAAANVEEALVERAYDQVKGADEPLMTIIEYGDFQ